MKQIPILFSTPMVQAILEGRKTQTRRIMKIQPDPHCVWGYGIRVGDPEHLSVHARVSGEDTWIDSPYGQPGDVLWVRETFCTADYSLSGESKHYYKADGDVHAHKWKPSIHMPKAAARIWLEVVSVKVERLQDITEQDAITEGVEKWNTNDPVLKDSYKWYTSRPLKRTRAGVHFARESFWSLWEAINGDGSWNTNPWVWVVEFRKIEKP